MSSTQTIFQEAIERYCKDKDERMNAALKKDAANPRKRQLSEAGGRKKHAKERRVSKDDDGTSSTAAADSDAGFSSRDADAELEKKRRASRLSSRRTREREKLRLDHFRTLESELKRKNETLTDENQLIRDLINKIKNEKEARESRPCGQLNSRNVPPQEFFPRQAQAGVAVSDLLFTSAPPRPLAAVSQPSVALSNSVAAAASQRLLAANMLGGLPTVNPAFLAAAPSTANMGGFSSLLPGPVRPDVSATNDVLRLQMALFLGLGRSGGLQGGMPSSSPHNALSLR